MSNNPKIFISHSSKDKDLAVAVQEQLCKAFDITPSSVFVSSTPDGIDCGEKWFDKVVEELNLADVFVVLLTPNSISSNWVWYEIGHFWSRKFGKNIFCLYKKIDRIPHPLNTLQAKNVYKDDEVRNFFRSMNDLYTGDLDKVDVAMITKIAETKNLSTMEYVGPLIRSRRDKRQYPRS